jgi:hypothetical protein
MECSIHAMARVFPGRKWPDDLIERPCKHMKQQDFYWISRRRPEPARYGFMTGPPTMEFSAGKGLIQSLFAASGT